MPHLRGALRTGVMCVYRTVRVVRDGLASRLEREVSRQDSTLSRRESSLEVVSSLGSTPEDPTRKVATLYSLLEYSKLCVLYVK